MAIAWMAVSGEYSSYGVHCVFTDKAVAEEFVAVANRTRSRWDQMELEEIPLLSAMPEHVGYWQAIINGRSLEVSPPQPLSQWDYQGLSEGAYVGVGRTAEEATKAAQDKAARMAAERAGIA